MLQQFKEQTKEKVKVKEIKTETVQFLNVDTIIQTMAKAQNMGSPLGKTQGHNTRIAKARQKVGKEKFGVEHGKEQKSTWQNNDWKGKGPNPWQFNQPVGSAIQKGKGKGKGKKGEEK